MQHLVQSWRNFEERHDELSSWRQQSIATVVFIVNLFLYVLFQVAKNSWNWHFSLGPDAKVLFYSTWFVATLFIAIASHIFNVLVDIPRSIRGNPPPRPVKEPPEITRLRKYPYYVAVLLYIFSIAVLVEQSGGLVRSPFTPVLFAMVLAAQQLGRFRTNSIIFLVMGILISLLLAAYERFAGLRSVPNPPDQLVFAILAAGFIAAALFTHVDKSPNFRARTVSPKPTHGALMREGSQPTWRMGLFVDRHGLDCILPYCSSGATEVTAKAAFERYVATDLAPALGTDTVVEWSAEASSNDRYFAILKPASHPVSP